MLKPETRELIELPRWSGLSAEERGRAIDGVIAALAGRGRALGVERFTLGGQAHDIALFECEDVVMALVPGGTVSLGWDRSPVALTAEQRAGWKEADDAGFASFEAMLGMFMTPARRVHVAPFLAQVEPTEVTELLEAVDEEDDPYAAVQAAVVAAGFQLPTSDQWEHACRAGSASFFRWGDQWPGGEPYGDDTDFELHRSRTAFGLALSTDPYWSECVRAGDCFRGGDGGSALCGGRPVPESWYTFASAFALPLAHVEDCIPETLEQAYARRVIDL